MYEEEACDRKKVFDFALTVQYVRYYRSVHTGSSEANMSADLNAGPWGEGEPEASTVK